MHKLHACSSEIGLMMKIDEGLFEYENWINRGRVKVVANLTCHGAVTFLIAEVY